MIIYKDYRFYTQVGKDLFPKNHEHEGLTALDVCEALSLCPFKTLETLEYTSYFRTPNKYTASLELKGENEFYVSMPSNPFDKFPLYDPLWIFEKQLERLKVIQLSDFVVKKRKKTTIGGATGEYSVILDFDISKLVFNVFTADIGEDSVISDFRICGPLFFSFLFFVNNLDRPRDYRDLLMERRGKGAKENLVLNIAHGTRRIFERAGAMEYFKPIIVFYELAK